MAANTSAKENASADETSGFGKVCRACTDFKTWMNMKKSDAAKKSAATDSKYSEIKSGSSDAAGPGLGPDVERSDCPLDRDLLGHNTWSFLHTMAAYYPERPSENQRQDMDQFVSLFAKFYPCDVCAEDLREKLKVLPPQTANQEEFSQWLCRIHNQVNVKLGKKEFDCHLVNQRWRDGWDDGSC